MFLLPAGTRRPVLKSVSYRLAVLSTVALSISHPLRAQDGASNPSASPTPRPADPVLYALASANKNEFSFIDELGFTVGGTLGLSRHLGLTEEGAMEHWRGNLHTYLALAGPRFSWQAGRLIPFGEVMAGLGHAGPGTPAPLPVPPNTRPTYYGPAGAVAAGLELRLTTTLPGGCRRTPRASKPYPPTGRAPAAPGWSSTSMALASSKAREDQQDFSPGSLPAMLCSPQPR
jgi:hypothetical protein